MNINLKKILLITCIILIVFVLSINSSFAATIKTEKFTKSTFKNTNLNKLEISKLYRTFSEDSKGNYKEYYNIVIRNDKQKQYKIKSVIANFYDGERNLFNKTYNGNKKLSLKFKGYENLSYPHITIKYYSTTSIKSEIGLYYAKDNSWKFTQLFKGKTATINTLEKGYTKTKGMNFPITTINKFQIKTKNSKYKIKSINVKYLQPVSEDEYYAKFKGYGSRKITITTPYKYKELYVDSLSINYY
jgi:hypothetical protein